MAVDYEAAEKLIHEYVAEVKTVMSIDRVYLYGSYASRTARWDSDVDLCFFSRAFENKSILDALRILCRIKRKYDLNIAFEPNAFPYSELNNDNPFVKEILRTGREL